MFLVSHCSNGTINGARIELYGAHQHAGMMLGLIGDDLKPEMPVVAKRWEGLVYSYWKG